MPQMAPINWLSLFLIFCLTFFMFNLMNYFSFNLKIKSKLLLNQNQMSKFNSYNIFLWKW